jgi:ABC-2 type transport system permease protein
MISDIWTVMRKEFKEFLLMRGRRGGLLSIAIMIGMFGIFLPLQSGPGWFSQGTVFFYAYIPCVTALGIVADAFAGERERRTLETLLASRLPDTAILFGKIATIVGYSWGSGLLSMLAALVTVNVKYGHAAVAKNSTMILGGIHVSTPGIVVTLAAAGLLLAVLITAVGILLSMKASTVKQVQQAMGMFMMGMFLAPTIGFAVIPKKVLASMFHTISSMGAKDFALLLAALFVLLDVVLLATSIARFRRSRLILD